jgi:hypothetical protein
MNLKKMGVPVIFIDFMFLSWTPVDIFRTRVHLVPIDFCEEFIFFTFVLRSLCVGTVIQVFTALVTRLLQFRETSRNIPGKHISR